MLLVRSLVLIEFFGGIVVVTQLIYTVTVSREITQFIIALGPDGPRAEKSRYLTPHRGISINCVISIL